MSENYKMAVLDIDGTILNDRKKASKRTKAVIGKLGQKNIPVCICTGRNIAGTLPVVRALKLTTPFACLDGMILYDPGQKKILYENIVENETMLKILEIAKKEHVYIEIVTWRHYKKYVQSKDLQEYEYGNVSQYFKRFYEYLFGVRRIKTVEDLHKEKEQIYQILAGGEPKALEKIKKAVLALRHENIEMREINGRYLFINAKGVSKEAGVRLLCRHFGVELSQVVAIGDEWNDVDMLRAAGMGVAMGNAAAVAKEAADYITDSNNRDGVAAALEKFFSSAM